MRNYRQSNKGFSFVELLITAAVFTLFFGGLFAGLQTVVVLIGESKAKAGARALATERLEYLRSLQYNSIGTIAGIPSGNIPQNSTTTLNGIEYVERVLVEYVDDAADGLLGADSNGIITDYKQIKVVYTWTLRGSTDNVTLISNIVPIGIETTAGGGTIRVNVFDAAVFPIETASVRFINDTTTSTIDTTRFTDSAGIAYLSGAPAAANYQIEVTKAGYSFDGTYLASTSNPNPITPPIAVVESAVSTMNFQIDQTSNLLLKTVGTATTGVFSDTFTDQSLLAATSSVTAGGGELELTDTLGVYDLNGTVLSTSTTPGSIVAWSAARFNATTSANTSVVVSIYYDTGSGYSLVPDSDLPNNSTGFSTSPINIGSLDPVTYATLALYATLNTTDSGETPHIYDWSITHVVSQPSIANIPLTVSGAKIIGTDAASQPVLKYSVTSPTDISGELSLSNIEWDIYTISEGSGTYDALEICGSSPYVLAPNVSDEVVITLGGVSANLLRVKVETGGGSNIGDATVQVQNTGVDLTSLTSLCGQAYFNDGSLFASSTYTVTTSAPGFVTDVTNNVTVSSSSTLDVILN